MYQYLPSFLLVVVVVVIEVVVFTAVVVVEIVIGTFVIVIVVSEMFVCMVLIGVDIIVVFEMFVCMVLIGVDIEVMVVFVMIFDLLESIDQLLYNLDHYYDRNIIKLIVSDKITIELELTLSSKYSPGNNGRKKEDCNDCDNDYFLSVKPTIFSANILHNDFISTS